MKSSILLLLIGLVLACSVPPGVDVEESKNGDEQSLNGPQTVFEGIWLWIKTEGEGITGSYEKDSVSEGHSVRYDFFSMSGLQVYFNLEKQIHYEYSFTVTEEHPDGTIVPGVLILENKQSGSPLPEHYYWEIKEVDGDTYLYLRNTEPCCDNTFTQHYKLISRHEIGSR